MSLPRPTRALLGSCLLSIVGFASLGPAAEPTGEGTRLLRQPDLNGRQVAFAYGGDLWIADLAGGEARRLTSTPAVERDPHFSPDGHSLAFSRTARGRRWPTWCPSRGGRRGG